MKGAYRLLFVLTMLHCSLVQAQSVRISALNDFSLGSWLGSGDLTSEDTLCIYNLGDADYRIKATGPSNSFTLNSSEDSILYEVYFKESSGSYVELTSGSWSNFSGADTVSDNCSGSTNAHLKITAREAELSGALAGNYTGTLTILLEPN